MALNFKTSSNNNIDLKGLDANIKLTAPSGGGSVFSVNGKVGEVNLTAEDIAFIDGDTFQEKYNSGELKGEKGDKGDKGADGVNGKDGKNGTNGTNGKDGKDGYTPIKGIDYFDGKDGKDGTNGTNGKDGANGKDGLDGYTPVKGTDYYTEADKEEMVNLVLTALPSSEGVNY